MNLKDMNGREKITVGAIAVLASSMPVALLGLVNVLPFEFCEPYCLASMVLGGAVIVAMCADSMMNLP